MRLAIADPPYPPHLAERRDRPGGPIRVTTRSRAGRYYGDAPRPACEIPADHHPGAADWDDPARHRALLEQLLDEYDGWAIATTPDGLECYRPLPIPARLMVWHRPTATPGAHRIASKFEVVIAYTPESRRGLKGFGQVSDVLTCNAPAIGFPGAKPARWTRWVLDAMGHNAETDTVDDLFPGSGSVAAAVAQGVLL